MSNSVLWKISLHGFFGTALREGVTAAFRDATFQEISDRKKEPQEEWNSVSK